MKRIITAIQVVILVLFVCIICLTSAPKTASVIVFTAVLLVLMLTGFLASNAGEKRLKARITELLRELNVASSRIGSVSQEIGITIDESNSSSNELFYETQEMNDLTADVTDNLAGMIAQLKGMINFSEEVRTTAHAMDSTSKASFESIQNGMSEIMHIVDTMKEVKITSSSASDSIEKLRAASGDVRLIIDKIGDISKQMHIIAINATVEASRAGHYGDGFAVIAKEFHSLSNMTDRSMNEISTLIDTIGQDIFNVYDIVLENSGRVDEGVQYTNVVEASLKDIDASFSDVVKMVDRISGIAEAQSRLAGDMGGCIENVESLIDRTNGNVKRVYESALGQKRGIENIAEMGSKLKIASMELLGIAGSSAEETTEKLDEKTNSICARFFPVMKQELGQHTDILSGDHALHYERLSCFKSVHKNIEAVWTNETNGRFICSIPKAGIANAAMRDWFRASLGGESYISPIYISSITKNRCVTVSMPYYGDDGAIAGIVGVDLNLDMLKTEQRQ